MPPTKPVVFFHVMKCGGTSIRSGLIDALAEGDASAYFELDGRASADAVGGLWASRDAIWRFRDSLLLYVLDALRPSLVVGHFRFAESHERLLESSHLVTVLRDPVERLISLYEYRRFNSRLLSTTPTFEEFLASDLAEIEGRKYVETFSGCGTVAQRASDQEIERAIENLDRFALVGFLDEIGAFAAALGELAGVPVELPFLNRSTAPAGHRDGLPEATMERLHELCEPDLRVLRALRTSASSYAS